MFSIYAAAFAVFVAMNVESEFLAAVNWGLAVLNFGLFLKALVDRSVAE